MSLRDQLKRLELQLQILVEANMARLGSSPDLSSLLIKNLIEAMMNDLKHEQDRLLAPNHYTVRLSPALAADLRNNPTLLARLGQALEMAGKEAGLIFPSTPNISILEDQNLGPGQFRTSARMILNPPGTPRSLAIKDGDDRADLPENAFLIINGNQIFPLTQPVVNIGRRVDNNLVVDNPSVSRIHAQLRAIDGHYVLFDLGSTGGTFVNSERVNRSVLYPGDVIALATAQLVYGQDAPRSLDEAESYTKPIPVDQKKTVTREKKLKRPSREEE